MVTPPYARWAELEATGRFRQLLGEIEETWPGATQDPDALPDEPWVANLVGDALRLAGRFDVALRFVDPSAPDADELRRELTARRELLAPLATLLQQSGRVTTVAGTRQLAEDGVTVRFHADSERIDVELCLLAITRMRPKLWRWLGVKLAQVEVDVFADRSAFVDCAQQLGARDLPEHVQGLAARASGRLLVELADGWHQRPYELYIRLRHELTHLAVGELLEPGGSVPTWMDEGLAIACSQGLSRGMRACWERAGERGLPWTMLSRGLPPNPAVRGVALTQSALAVQALLRSRGSLSLAAAIRDGRCDRLLLLPEVASLA